MGSGKVRLDHTLDFGLRGIDVLLARWCEHPLCSYEGERRVAKMVCWLAMVAELHRVAKVRVACLWGFPDADGRLADSRAV